MAGDLSRRELLQTMPSAISHSNSSINDTNHSARWRSLIDSGLFDKCYSQRVTACFKYLDANESGYFELKDLTEKGHFVMEYLGINMNSKTTSVANVGVGEAKSGSAPGSPQQSGGGFAVLDIFRFFDLTGDGRVTIDVFAIVIIETLMKKMTDKTIQRRVIEDFCDAPAGGPVGTAANLFSADALIAFMEQDEELLYGRGPSDAFGGGFEIITLTGARQSKPRIAVLTGKSGERRDFVSYKRYLVFYHYILKEKVRRHLSATNGTAIEITERVVRDFITSTFEIAVMEIMSQFSLGEAKIARIVAASIRATATVQKRLSSFQSKLRRIVARYSDGTEALLATSSSSFALPVTTAVSSLLDDTNFSELSFNGDARLDATGSTYYEQTYTSAVQPHLVTSTTTSKLQEINKTLLYLKGNGINLSDLSACNIVSGEMDENQKFFLEISFLALKSFFSATHMRGEVDSKAANASQKLGLIQEIILSHNNNAIDVVKNNFRAPRGADGQAEDDDLLVLLNNELVLANERIHMLSIRNHILSLLHGSNVQFADVEASQALEAKESSRIASRDDEELDPEYYKLLTDPNYYKQVIFSKKDSDLILSSDIGKGALAAVSDAAAEIRGRVGVKEATYDDSISVSTRSAKSATHELPPALAPASEELDSEDISRIIVDNVNVSYENLHEELRELQLAVSTIGCKSQFLGLTLDEPAYILSADSSANSANPKALLGDFEKTIKENSSFNRSGTGVHSTLSNLKVKNKALEGQIFELKTSAEQHLQERIEYVANSIELQCLRMEIQRCYEEIELGGKHKKEATDLKNSCRELQATIDSLKEQLLHHQHSLLSSPSHSDGESAQSRRGDGRSGSRAKVSSNKAGDGAAKAETPQYSEDAEAKIVLMQKDINRLQNLVKSTEQRMKDSLSEQMSLNQQLHLTQDELIQSQTFIAQLLKDLDFERRRWSSSGPANDAKYISDIEDELSSLKARLVQEGSENYKNKMLLAELLDAEERVSMLENRLSEMQIEIERGKIALEQLDNYRDQVRLKIQENRQLSLQLHSLQSTVKGSEGQQEMVNNLETTLKEAKGRVEKIPGLLAEIARLRGTSRASAKSLNEQDAFLAQFKIRITRLEGENGRLRNDIRNFVDNDSKLKEANNTIDSLMKQLADLKLQVSSAKPGQQSAVASGSSSFLATKAKFKAAAHAIVDEVLEHKSRAPANHANKSHHGDDDGSSNNSSQEGQALSSEESLVSKEESAAKVQSVIQSVAAKPNVRRVSMTLRRLSTAPDSPSIDVSTGSIATSITRRSSVTPSARDPVATNGSVTVDLSTPHKRSSIIQSVSAGLTNSGGNGSSDLAAKTEELTPTAIAAAVAATASETAQAPSGIPQDVFHTQKLVARLAFESVKAIRGKYKE